MQYYLYDYHFGFIKRGLIGQILNFFGNFNSHSKVLRLSILCIVLIGILVFKIIDLISFKNNILNYFLLALFFLHPALLKNLWFDIGRLDMFPIAYCVFLILFCYTSKLLFFKAILLLISPIFLFVHESVFILWLPAYYVCWYLSVRKYYDKQNIIVYSLIFIIISILCLSIIQFFGKLNINHTIFLNYLISKSNDNFLFEKSVITEFGKLDFISILKINLSNFAFWTYGLTCIFLLIFIIKLVFKYKNISFSSIYLYFILPLLISSLIFTLGFDILRWVSNICFELFFIMLSLLLNSNKILKIYIDLSNEDLFFYVINFINVITLK